MSEAIEYSKRLGRISDAQFAQATERLGVGKFLRATPTTSGLFGQNVFLTTSEGEFVLRGAPHWVDLSQGGPWRFEQNDLWQFSKEAWFANALHEQTGTPVPWPPLLDKASDIFGWPYIIMPRMPGKCFLDDRELRNTLSIEQRYSAARALGSMLAQQQKLVWPFAGDFNLSLELAPYPGGHTEQVVRQTRKFADNARLYGAMGKEDDDWISRVADAARAQSAERPAVYLHGDFKPGNLTMSMHGDDMIVTGVFDLHESRFGDGASDICRQACGYLDFDPDMARTFVETYRALVGDDPTLEQRMPLYIINDRIKFWEFFKRPPGVDWLKGHTFRSWTSRYINGVLALL
jgi:hygromycin-B 7''-O-kinase